MKETFMLNKMKELVREKDTCVLATVGQGSPHCSLMAYVADDGCSEIYMVTQKDSRKYRNLMENPRVSLLIDTREDHIGLERPRAKALTISAILRPMEDSIKIDAAREKLLAKHPLLSKFLNNPDAAILCIKIDSFLLLDGLTDAYFEKL